MVRTLQIAAILALALLIATCARPKGYDLRSSDDKVMISPSTGASVGSIWGVFIGLSRFQNKDLNLDFAAKDAEKLYDLFTRQFSGRVQQDHFVLLTNADATRKRVISKLKSVLLRAMPEDLVVIFIATHGLADITGTELFFFTHETDANDPEADSVARDEIEKLIGHSKAKRIVLMLDACHAGGFGTSPTATKKRGAGAAEVNLLLRAVGRAHDGIALFTSSSAAEVSHEGTEFCGGHGAFTCALLEGLGGPADENDNGLVEIREMYEFAYRRVKELTSGAQHPNLDGRYDNSLPIAVVGTPLPIRKSKTKETPGDLPQIGGLASDDGMDLSYYDDMLKQALEAQAERERADQARARHLKRVESAWGKVKQTAKIQALKNETRIEVVKRFMTDFPSDNSYLENAEALVGELQSESVALAVSTTRDSPSSSKRQPKADEPAARFKNALRLFDGKKYEDAAREFLEIVKSAPDFEQADNALQNAALAFQMARKFEVSAGLYERIYKEYPKSDFADTALFKLAHGREQGFNFETAIDNYLLLVEKYPESKHRQAALWNASIALENIQNYPKASQSYLRFAQLFPEHEKAPDAVWKAIGVYQKMNDWNTVIKTCDLFNKKFGKDPKQSARTVETLVKVAEAYTEMKNQKAAQKTYEDVLKEFHHQKLGTNTRAAYFAAKAKFLQAEQIFAKYDALKLGNNVKNLRKELEAKAKMNIEVNKAYEAVMPYKQAEWTLASLHRIAYAKQRFSETIFEAPVPKELKTDEEKAMYQDQLAEVAAPIEDAALELYKNAAKVATDLKVVNEWTRNTQEALARLRPSHFPLQKETKSLFEESVLPSATLDSSADDVPQKARTVFQTGLNLVFADREGSKAAFGQALAMVSPLPAAHNNIGLILEWQGKYGEAEAEYRAAISKKADYFAAMGNLADLLVKKGNAPGAEAYVKENLAKFKHSIALRNKLAAVHVAMGKNEEAMKASMEILKQDEKNTPAMLNLAQAYFAQKKFELADMVLENAKEIDPTLAKVYVLKGYMALAQKDKITAIDMFKKALELRDDLPDVHNNLGCLFNEAHDFPAAAAEFKKALQYWPEFTKARLNLANSLRGNKQYEEALEEYKKVLSAGNGGNEVLFNLGILYLDMEHEFQGSDPITRLKTAKDYLEKYAKSGGLGEEAEKRVAEYIKEAEKNVKRKELEIERQKKRKIKEAEEKKKKEAEELKRKEEEAKKAAELEKKILEAETKKKQEEGQPPKPNEDPQKARNPDTEMPREEK